uniref:Uncharacterized protein n=1 Tax=Arundo donax TaxID=35708 RepID=A0A0A9IL64_ARUDO
MVICMSWYFSLFLLFLQRHMDFCNDEIFFSPRLAAAFCFRH